MAQLTFGQAQAKTAASQLATIIAGADGAGDTVAPTTAS